MASLTKNKIKIIVHEQGVAQTKYEK